MKTCASPPRMSVRVAVAFASAVAVLVAVGCERESRPVDKLASAATQPAATLSDLFPGSAPPPADGTSPFQHNAWGIAEGKRLFTYLNCVGCHANGGGGMGPPLMDDKWIYGFEPGQVFATIVQGRPNGMPSFMNKIPDHQVWQIAAYVRSMSGLVRQDAAPGRSDHMKNRPPENTIDPKSPTQGGVPSPASEMPQ